MARDRRQRSPQGWAVAYGALALANAVLAVKSEMDGDGVATVLYAIVAVALVVVMRLVWTGRHPGRRGRVDDSGVPR